VLPVLSPVCVLLELPVLVLPPELLALELLPSPVLVLPVPVLAPPLVVPGPHPSATTTAGPSKPPNRRRPPRDMGTVYLR